MLLGVDALGLDLRIKLEAIAPNRWAIFTKPLPATVTCLTAST